MRYFLLSLLGVVHLGGCAHHSLETATIRAWLVEQKTVEQAKHEIFRLSDKHKAWLESSEIKPDALERHRIHRETFAARWEDFASQLQKEDQLWFYSFSPKTWERLSGEAGYAIVRKGKVIARFVTMMN